MLHRVASLILAVTAGLSPVWSSSIQIQSVELFTKAGYSTWSPTSDLYQIATTTNGWDFSVSSQRTTLPLGTTVQTSELRRSKTENTYTLADDATDFAFEVDLFARYDASRYSLSQSYGIINFTVTGDMIFGMESNLTLQSGSPSNANGLGSSLLDVTTNQTLYSNSTGLLTSNQLVSGHQYRLNYGTWIQSNPVATEGTSTGFVRFTAENAPVAAVPEPGTLALFGFGLVGMGIAIRKRRK